LEKIAGWSRLKVENSRLRVLIDLVQSGHVIKQLLLEGCSPMTVKVPSCAWWPVHGISTGFCRKKSENPLNCV